MSVSPQYRDRIKAVLDALGIDASLLQDRPLRLIAEAQHLVPVGLGTDRRDKLLAPAAAQAWRALQTQAAADGIVLQVVSTFRSVDFQARLIRDKLQRGMAVAEILRINAPPGYSEHHSGCAIDIGTPGVGPLEEAFESTAAFAWLQVHAGQFGFRLSYPRNNPEGYLYEPWHWCHRGS